MYPQQPMKPYWTDGESAWYRIHLAERNYSVKASEDPFGEVSILQVKTEWNGGKRPPQPLLNGEEYDQVCAAFLNAKSSPAA
jgi:hypothetical protein